MCVRLGSCGVYSGETASSAKGHDDKIGVLYYESTETCWLA